MQIRVKNLNKGNRGIYVDAGLVFIDGNSTGTFTGATAAERDAAATMEGLRVQSRDGQDGEWTDHFKEEMPEEKPWLALATDDAGGNFKPLTAADGVWYVGMAVSGERPDGPAGYTWHKVGSVGAMEALVAEPAPEPEQVAEPDKIVDYGALVTGTAPDVIKAVTRENAMDIGAAEEKREAGARKGVMKAVEEAMASEEDK